MSTVISQFLERIHYPRNYVTVDVETFYTKDYTLSKCSHAEYINDPRFQILGWAVKRNSDPAEFVPQWPWDLDVDDTTFIMHNARFDAAVLRWHYGMNLPFILDTRQFAAHYFSRMSHSLENLGKFFNLPVQKKTDISIPHGISAYKLWNDPVIHKTAREYAIGDVDTTLPLLEKLIPFICTPVTEMAVMTHTLNMFLNPVFEFDSGKSHELIRKLSETMESALTAAECIKAQISGNLSFHALLDYALEPYGQSAPTKLGRNNTLILAVSKSDPGRRKMESHKSEKVRAIMNARSLVRSLPLHIKRLTKIGNQAKALGGRVPVEFVYYAAHTGRWGGGGGVNLQNLPSRGDSDIVRLSEVITAPPGHVLLESDFSAVEARGLAWCAGQKNLLDDFAAGKDIYCVFISEVMNRQIRKPIDSDSEKVTKEMKFYRQLGKVCILGLGYGTGYLKLQAMAKLRGIDITESQAKDLTYAYRRKYKKIPQFWNDLEAGFRLAFNTQEPTQPTPYIKMQSEGGDVVSITLPSGRRLYYHYVVVNDDSIKVYDPRHKSDIHLWGGVFCENVIQALCRDLLWNAIAEIEKHGVSINLHKHDSVVACVPIEKAKMATTVIRNAMTSVPDWATGFPLSCEIEESYHL